MGRRLRGAALKAHKRGKEHAKEIVEQQANETERASVVAKADEELFVIDKSGDAKANCPQQIKQNLTKKEAVKVQKQRKSSLSLLDQKKVEQLLEKHDAKKLQTMSKESQDKMRGDRRAVARNNERKLLRNPTNNNNKKKMASSNRRKFDLWGDDDDVKKAKAITATTTNGTTTNNNNNNNNNNNKNKKVKNETEIDNAKKEKVLQTGGVKGAHVELIAKPVSKKPTNAIAVDVAHAGQSYRPDPQQYKEIVQDAMSMELNRQKAQDYNRAPLAAGMSAETRALLIDDSSDDDDDSDSDNEQGEQRKDEIDDTNVLHKRRDKLTRAQRNKQKRLRQEKAIEDKQRKNKKLLNSISEIPRYKKEIKKQQEEMQEKKTQLIDSKKKTEGTPGKNVLLKYSQKDPINVPTLPVALEVEHKDSSLRTMKPKGSLITDRMASFVDRDLVSKRKMGDKKRIVQGKRRKINIKGNRGHDIIKAMDGAILG